MKKVFVRTIGIAIALSAAMTTLCAQEAIKSERAEYFDLLVLAGMAERPYINYQTLSDATWDIPDSGHPWASVPAMKNASRGGIRLRIYGPELYASYNFNRPRGQNDGALWQGRGFNSSLTAGIGVEGDWFSATLKPMLSFSQNLSFDTMTAAVQGSAKIANPYGYYWSCGVDAPQRFGDSAFFDWDWGDSELRATLPEFSIKGHELDIPLTIGFGTEALWLGPARENPILHSNNAPTYPRLDFGLRKMKTPIGNFEARAFWGALKESQYFDSDGSNDYRLITAATISYEPSFMPGFSVGFHRTMLSKWADQNWGGMLTLVWPFMSDSAGGDRNDQRASFSFDYVLPAAGFEAYWEWGRNDYSPNLDFIIRYPFHTGAWTFGARKLFRSNGDAMWGLLEAELTNLEVSHDYEFLWPTSFYGHNIVSQGFTSEGQWLGAGIGTGGNSQRIAYTLYCPKGKISVHAQRLQKDSDYVWFLNWGGTNKDRSQNEYKFNATLSVGTDVSLFLDKGFRVSLGVDLYLEHNPLYNPFGIDSTKLYDGQLRMTFAWDIPPP
jgi:hypothetical protein